ncbi:hypothetical protein HK102_000280 [Quaeritorhiza haematococci]|nr:hypothetical protein HK102_000280 [Quaeritorhiza haematococci]
MSPANNAINYTRNLSKDKYTLQLPTGNNPLIPAFSKRGDICFATQADIEGKEENMLPVEYDMHGGDVIYVKPLNLSKYPSNQVHPRTLLSLATELCPETLEFPTDQVFLLSPERDRRIYQKSDIKYAYLVKEPLPSHIPRIDVDVGGTSGTSPEEKSSSPHGPAHGPASSIRVEPVHLPADRKEGLVVGNIFFVRLNAKGYLGRCYQSFMSHDENEQENVHVEDAIDMKEIVREFLEERFGGLEAAHANFEVMDVDDIVEWCELTSARS